ncbi:Mov34/MPN/PAD-1 family protein [Pseudomonas sp. R3.Fl]|jgi:integrative and conjugative element protein (TIGR02256 family)|nr:MULTISPECIES: Mov34/MPN/PAD-1 family protein [Pseudomonas]MDX4002886.1 Mov34/MPN/PAD-1 family protein [Pseudomonas aeruginosa]AMO77612.1 hypothetical protein PcP3B5_42110 [Pseudomonas citronellolis]MCL6692192.1 Mov34/MPN/PAD-1 family protein [Pseudomonas sp. R3.Fl]MDN6875808.1 Mov34/MPN/PAD-1 family protein [Pseudomonas citronellolis]GBL57961.1 thiazole biosynthesis protein ThiF [Pseudomonas citronellolis]
MIEYFELGDAVACFQEDALYPETITLLNACRASPHIDVRELRCETIDGARTDYIIIDAGDGTVDSGNPAGIRRRERLAIGINPQYRVPILVHTLRKDFPALSHQHPTVLGRPRMLCLYDSAWAAVQRGWTPQRFIARMFWWLRESAQLKLHREDQPLEPLFYMSPCQLILPANYADYIASDDQALNFLRVPSEESIILRAVPADPSNQSKAVRVISINVPPVDSTAVVALPGTLGSLQEQLEAWGSDLAEQLYTSVFDAIPDGVVLADGAGEGMLILLWVPRTRAGALERADVIGYLMTSSLLELADAFEMLGMPDQNGRRLRIALLDGYRGSGWRSLPLLPVEVRSALTAQFARELSAVEPESAQFDGVLAGVGALGSALADLWVRQGWGRWTYVDPDRLMPHNLSRHLASDDCIGFLKADVMRAFARDIYPNELAPVAIAKSIVADDEQVHAALDKAQLVVDVTTTFEVPRELAHMQDAPRTVSLFLAPSGLSSVMILEDQDRKQRIDGLEGQYYRAILTSEWGSTHLANHLGDRWVGGGCRDISVRMSNESVHTHAGILSRQLRQSVLRPDARLCIWTYEEHSGAVSAHEVPVWDVVSRESNGWTIKYDTFLVEKLRHARVAALPNETGGSVLGVTDFKSKTIVVVDVLPTPSDSRASSSHFIRGEEGQQEMLEEVHRRTARVVDYIGEWHSHPDGCSSRPSQDDEKLLDTLHRKMSAEGLPALMVIVARDEESFLVR